MKLKVLASSSRGNCYILTSNAGESLILEAGIRSTDILKGLNYDLSSVAGCVVSHFHQDHAKAVKDLAKGSIDVYASQETFTALKIKGYRLHPIEAEKQFKVGSFTILPFPVEHDAPGTMGFLIQCEDEKILFLTDTYYCQYKFKGLTNVLIECNCSNDILKENSNKANITLVKRILKSHFSLENVIEFLKANDRSKLKNIVLIHLSDTNSHAKQFEVTVEGIFQKPVYVADTGLEVNLSSVSKPKQLKEGLKVIQNDTKIRSIGNYYSETKTLQTSRKRSIHFHRNFNAWGIDKRELENLIGKGMEYVVVFEQEANKKFKASVVDFMEYGKYAHFKPHRPQLFLEESHWREI